MKNIVFIIFLGLFSCKKKEIVEKPKLQETAIITDTVIESLSKWERISQNLGSNFILDTVFTNGTIYSEVDENTLRYVHKNSNTEDIYLAIQKRKNPLNLSELVLSFSNIGPLYEGYIKYNYDSLHFGSSSPSSSNIISKQRISINLDSLNLKPELNPDNFNIYYRKYRDSYENEVNRKFHKMDISVFDFVGFNETIKLYND